MDGHTSMDDVRFMTLEGRTSLEAGFLTVWRLTLIENDVMAICQDEIGLDTNTLKQIITRS